VARVTNVTRHSTNGILTTESLGCTPFNFFFILFFGAGGLLMLLTGWNDKDRSVPWIGAACFAGAVPCSST
jgi:hypothetical protein